LSETNLSFERLRPDFGRIQCHNRFRTELYSSDFQISEIKKNSDFFLNPGKNPWRKTESGKNADFDNFFGGIGSGMSCTVQIFKSMKLKRITNYFFEKSGKTSVAEIRIRKNADFDNFAEEFLMGAANREKNKTGKTPNLGKIRFVRQFTGISGGMENIFGGSLGFFGNILHSLGGLLIGKTMFRSTKTHCSYNGT
jgi:hypothetical protein